MAKDKLSARASSKRTWSVGKVLPLTKTESQSLEEDLYRIPEQNPQANQAIQLISFR